MIEFMGMGLNVMINQVCFDERRCSRNESHFSAQAMMFHSCATENEESAGKSAIDLLSFCLRVLMITPKNGLRRLCTVCTHGTWHTYSMYLVHNSFRAGVIFLHISLLEISLPVPTS
jgi:hypothetical protein